MKVNDVRRASALLSAIADLERFAREARDAVKNVPYSIITLCPTRMTADIIASAFLSGADVLREELKALGVEE